MKNYTSARLLLLLLEGKLFFNNLKPPKPQDDVIMCGVRADNLSLFLDGNGSCESFLLNNLSYPVIQDN